MEQIILGILEKLRAGEPVDDAALVKLVHAEARRTGASKSALAKRQLLPYCQRVKAEEPARWASWGVTPKLERQLLQVLRMKPRRSASGVATITVLTKPWPCSGDCLFCPSDLRCPKSYLHDEPACARAEQNYYDPYLQVSARLTALSQMGHATDKIELIVLGGTWSDYPEGYQLWFMHELFRALNENAVAKAAANPMVGQGAQTQRARAAAVWNNASEADLPAGVAERRAFYRACGLPQGEGQLQAFTAEEQARVDATGEGFNAAVRRLYGESPAWQAAARMQTATLQQLERQQHVNEQARHRVVGLVIETRPDAVSPESLTLIRQLGCTKIQMGVQSVNQALLDANGRRITVAQIQRAFELARLFGFKTHAHFMLNLLGATPKSDKRDYRAFVQSPAYCPDEVKLYPCALIEGARLCQNHARGEWRPYTEEELLDVLASDVVATPAYCRISRMIRDFSSNDILVGNKKPNLRQLVEARLGGRAVQEIRFREVATDQVDLGELSLHELAYETTATSERFLQWTTPENRIAGFLRLSLPKRAAYEAAGGEEALPTCACEAMIREVHVYGMATGVGAAGEAAQHHGLGRRLVERACEIARETGYARVNVISAVGTRAYYRKLGFEDHGLYQQKSL